MLASQPGLARPAHTPFWPWPGTGPDDKWPGDDREQQRTMAPWGGGMQESGPGCRSERMKNRGVLVAWIFF